MPSLDLHPIDDHNVDVATSMLVRGFPEQSRAFWDTSLQRILTMHDAPRHLPIGYLMTVGNDGAGIVLTIPSQRASGTSFIDVVHLAAWYIEEQYRWLAARMMKKVVAATDAVFYDLTPNAASQVINRKLGFDVLHEGFLIYLLPVTALRRNGAGKMLSIGQAAPLLPPRNVQMLEQHRTLGCIVAALQCGSRLSPLVFAPIERRGVPGARLIHADSKKLVTENLGVISRALLREKRFFLRMDATHNDSAAGSFTSRWTEPAFIKGPRGDAEIDLTYSELVFLGA